MPTPKPPPVPPLQDPAIGDDAPMTEKQAAILRDLTEQQGLEFDTSLTEAQAADRIRALQETKAKQG